MSSSSSALRQLEALADARKAQIHPNLPPHTRVKSKFQDTDANGLTKCILAWFDLHGHWASRFDSTGLYRSDLGRYVPSQQRPGHPDVLACVNGHYVAVEVKVGRDRLSTDQRQCLADLKSSGASVYVASTFQAFVDWYQTQFSAVCPPVIPRLATPTLPKIPQRAVPSLFEKDL